MLDYELTYVFAQHEPLASAELAYMFLSDSMPKIGRSLRRMALVNHTLHTKFRIRRTASPPAAVPWAGTPSGAAQGHPHSHRTGTPALPAAAVRIFP